MAKPTHPRTRELLTVSAFARLAGVSERTLWYDIAGGRLTPERVRPTRLSRSALATYRALPLTAGGDRRLLTVREVRILLGVSTRTVRRRIREGWFVVVRVSARRLLIDAECSRVSVRTDGTVLTIAQLARMSLPDLQRAIKLRTQRRQYIAVGVSELACRAREGRLIQFFTVPEIARLSKKSSRTVYHDLKKQVGAKGGMLALHLPRIRISWIDAITYADRPEATDAIIASVVKGQFWHADAAVRAEIARGFAAWWRTSAPHS